MNPYTPYLRSHLLAAMGLSSALIGVVACPTKDAPTDHIPPVDDTDSGGETGDTDSETGDSSDTGDSIHTGDSSDTGDSLHTGDSGDTAGDTGDSGVDTAATTCSTTDELTTSHADYPWSVGGHYLVCVDRDTGGDCPDYTSVSAWDLLDESLGAFPDPFCGWTGTMICGPEESIVDQCCYEVDVGIICMGRPFLVDGTARMAPVTATGSWQSRSRRVDAPARGRLEAASIWMERAREEHASVAAFARFSLQLLSLGAPAELLAAAAEAMAEEVRHATGCFEIASALLGRSIGPGPMQMDSSNELDLAALIVDTVHHGCIGESIAAAQARMEAELATDSDTREMLVNIAEDESRHAALAWRFVQWILRDKPELLPAVDGAFESWRVPVMDQESDGLEAFGILDSPARRVLAMEVFCDVIQPCRRALLGDSNVAMTSAMI